MENQPPANQPASTGRQWFRLASLARLESLRQPDAPPAPAPAAPAEPPQPTQPPVPRIPLPRTQAEPRPQPPPPPSPHHADGAPSSSQEHVITQATQSQTPQPPPESPRAIEQSSPNPLPESPRIQRQLRPIKAPTPQPEPEPNPSPAPTPTKNMFMQHQQGNSSPNVHVKTIADINDKPPVNGDQPHVDGRKETAPWKKEERGEMNVITMAGENMGAFMEVAKQQRQRGYLLQHHQTKGGESPVEDAKSDKAAAAAAKGKHMSALVNSNVQSINNSIIFRSSCTQQSPGVRMTLISQRRPRRNGGH